MAEITATRYHDFSCGHRVVGHENKCRYLHGHNYRVTFTCRGALDSVGRVIDFGVIKSSLCMWLETHWDHKTLLWGEDPLWLEVFKRYIDSAAMVGSERDRLSELDGSIVVVPFNPTAENMAKFLLEEVGPDQLYNGVELIKVVVEETRKCSAAAEL